MASSIPVTVVHPELGELQVLPRQVAALEPGGWKLKKKRRKASSGSKSGGGTERSSARSADPDQKEG